MQELIRLSRLYGADEEYVLAGGGNTSCKDERTLWVKASGSALATIDGSGFVALDRGRLQELLDARLPAETAAREAACKSAMLAARREPEKNQRPSVEALLHHLLPARYVVHTHPLAVNALTCCAAGERLTAEHFGEDVLWMGYVTPGFPLAVALREAIGRWSQRTGRACPPAIFIENHGLFVCADEGAEIERISEDVSARARALLSGFSMAEAFGDRQAMLDAGQIDRVLSIVSPSLRALLGEGGRLKTVRFDGGEAAGALACGAAGEDETLAGPLTPDHQVYCGSYPMWFSPDPDEAPENTLARLREALDGHRKRFGASPHVVVLRGAGLLCCGDDLPAARTCAAVYRNQIELYARARFLGGSKAMRDEDRRFIEDWEAESYRRKVAAAAGGAGRVSGRVALVTGAAQGFGREIAEALADEGAAVFLADINADGVAAAAEEVNAARGRKACEAVAMNVTDETSVAAAARQVLRSCGGLDLLVCNAGVLRAGSVRELALKDFRFVTDVNYTGYFLCVRGFADLMAAQHAADPSARMDIVQINSKSGLAGSNKNGAYAGSKFGGLGLTQSFALELIECGIKVNSICPGNFFDGPLWSDPDNGLFVQYLRTGKVPGAKTVEDVKRAYEAKVPMGRGCRSEDVMRALYYLVDQQYETGQALPVTGGQVMLN
jgi:rhamnose utilization protein RhaD (predicted bifunctional aldolase and dehydrogenase)/NAD(P)-dependent dehydrogenase (short-subunit alcohol dehydrogenase family)